MDEYSRYPIVHVTSSTSARSVIPILDNVFSMFGIVSELKTDNGAPFNGEEFKQFAKHYGFVHQIIIPVWHKDNDIIERFMKNLGKVVQSAHIQKKSYKQELHEFLRSYRSTPHTTTGVAPADLMFGRPVKCKLPQCDRSVDDILLRAKDKQGKEKMKMYGDRHTNKKQCDISVGDSVLVKQNKTHKAMSPFNPSPYVVTNIKGTRITAKRNNHFITRNVSHFKKVRNATNSHTADYESDAEIYDDTDVIGQQQPPAQTTPNSPPRRRYPQRDRRPARYLVYE